MGSRLLQFISNKYLNAGILQSFSKEDARRVRVTNTIAVITSVLVVIYGVSFYLLLSSLYILVPALCCGPLFFSAVWLNKAGKYDMARHGLVGVFLMVLLYYGCLLGKVAEVQLLAVFVISVTLLMSKPGKTRARFFALAVPITCLIILEVVYYRDTGFFGIKLDLSEQTQNYYRWMIMPVVVFLNFLVITLYQSSIEELLETLRNRNNTLRKSRDENSRQKKLLQVNSDRLAEQVKERTAELDRANQSKTIFISELSHEISSPLNAIMEISRQLSDPATGGRITGHQLRTMQKNSDQLQQLMKNVRQLSEIEEGKAEELHYGNFALKAWLADAVDHYSCEARTHDIEILKEIDPRFPEMIFTDKVVLGEVIHHVLSSAVKFTEARKRVRVRGFLNAGKLFIQVCDQSSGIAMDKIQSLFRPFDEADRDICRKYGGSGFGLAIAKRKIGLLGGDLQISSTLGEGTNFLISWPTTVSQQQTSTVAV